MNEKEVFFTKNQDRLLSIAGWAKNLAWIVLIIYIINTGLVVVQKQLYYEQLNSWSLTSGNAKGYWDVVFEEPFYYFVDIGADMVSVLLRGFIYYVILKGISLGLYMILETDINYREQKENGRGL